MTTYALALNFKITIHDVSYTYRRFGRSVGIPLFLNMHFRGTMDHWDPALINPLAACRPIILLDSAGVGHSGGTIPTTFAAWATIVIEFLLALRVDKVDVFGFSMGGCAAQMIALNAPKGLVRRVVLAGTMPSVGKGTMRASDMTPFNLLRKAATREEQLEAFLKSFFGPSDQSQAAGKASFERIHSGRRDRTDYLGIEQTRRQGLTFVNFQDEARISEGSYTRFTELDMPILIANGKAAL